NDLHLCQHTPGNPAASHDEPGAQEVHRTDCRRSPEGLTNVRGESPPVRSRRHDFCHCEWKPSLCGGYSPDFWPRRVFFCRKVFFFIGRKMDTQTWDVFWNLV